MIHLKAAKDLLDFGARIGDARRGHEQLEGAVAIHNILEKENVAYLADEVGMGKTYVALGAMALFRHYNPNFRVLVIAPRENIQKKWMKEHENFVTHNVRYADMRVKAIGGRPARAQVLCPRLSTLAREAAANPNRDFFARMTSFSLALGDDASDSGRSWVRLREDMQKALPWLEADVFRGTKKTLKDNMARALCCALPVFDLVIIDEAHNLKYGFKEDSSARNRALSIALGHPKGAGDAALFPGYGPRAKRVLFLSATPIDGAWRHLWNQLDVVGRADAVPELCEEPESEEEVAAVKAAVRRFLVRRVTCMKVGEVDLTKNLYRREWRRGGVAAHDEPVRVVDDRQRLVLALVQKKVSELINSETFNSSFQIGMLASFESFLQTAKVRDDEGAPANFDDNDQTKDHKEREGIDVNIVNRLAKDYRDRFGGELPHPKMDALVEALSRSWVDGRKSLVFVRRVASVKELKRKLDDRYDEWLFDKLRGELPTEAQARLENVFVRFGVDKREARDKGDDAAECVRGSGRTRKAEADSGGADTFFAYFFRGDGPKGVLSGSAIQKRFASSNGGFGSFFERNHVADLLGVRPGEVTVALAGALQLSEVELRREMAMRMVRFLPRTVRLKRGERFEAAQAATVAALKDVDGPWRERAQALWHIRYATYGKHPHTTDVPALDDLLETRTFFTELKLHPILRSDLWPACATGTTVERFAEEERRGMLLSTAARLGHAFIDLYVLVIRRVKSLEARAQDDDADASSLVDDYLTMLNTQREGGVWGAYRELAAVSESYELLLDTNVQDLKRRDLVDVPSTLATFMQRQQPIGGMSGSINGRLVKQFRMPGYPFVLVTTDLLQEGEDLHTFCSDVYHYGIAWTPSAMEQRIGRIDRVRSHTDRRLAALAKQPEGNDKLQVFYPYLEDTVEKLQVDVVLERMDQFLRLMHEGLNPPRFDEKKLDVAREILAAARPARGMERPLKTAFPIEKTLLLGDVREPVVSPKTAAADLARFDRLKLDVITSMAIRWEERAPAGILLGTATLRPDGAVSKAPARQQPFVLTLRSVNELLVVRCVSPVGQVIAGRAADTIEDIAANSAARIGVILGAETDRYDLTVEDDVLLGDPIRDAERVAGIIARVVQSADRIEQQELPSLDQVLAKFQPHIEREAVPDDV